jgi:hypothetical protein
VCVSKLKLHDCLNDIAGCAANLKDGLWDLAACYLVRLNWERLRFYLDRVVNGSVYYEC